MNKQELLTYVAGLRLTDLKPSDIAGGQYVCFSTPGNHAEQAWRLLREHVDRTLRWPIVMGNLEGWFDSEPEPVDEILAKAAQIDVARWIAERVEEDAEYYRERCEERPGRIKIGKERKYQWSSLRNVLTGQWLNPVYILMAPTAIPWEVAAHVGFGGWNECPFPEVHVAMHKYWHEKWHAEPFAITTDVVEMHVRKPVRTAEEAFALAREQYVYAPDVVDQGTETIGRLAEEIANCDGWFFWWD